MRALRHSVVLVVSLGVLAMALQGALGAASGGLPNVPACLAHATSGVACDGLLLKSGGTPIEKETSANGVFVLTAPIKATSPQRTKPVACGSLGCDYNHYDWVLYGGVKGSAGIVSDIGCRENQPTCTIKLASGGSEWTPVLVNLNDFPVTIFLLYRAEGSAGAASGLSFVVRTQETGWAATSLTLSSGETVTLTSSGNGTCDGVPPLNPGLCPPNDPNGSGTLCGAFYTGHCPVSSLPIGSVDGRIGVRGRPFLIGKGPVIERGVGTLYLAYDDCRGCYVDNRGTFRVVAAT